MLLLHKITLGKKHPSTKSIYLNISTQESELTDGINFAPPFALLLKVAHELSLVHKSQRREQRDLTTRCDVTEGRPHSLICLQIPSSLGGPLPSPPPHELNNLNVGLHTHVIINKLCPHPLPFHRLQNKNKVKSARLPTATSRITNVLEVLKSKGKTLNPPNTVVITFYMG